MEPSLSLYGWQVSPFTAKVRAYLDFKNIPYQEIVPSAFTLNGKIKNDVGQLIMPVVYQGDQAIQDSSVIIDTLESQHPKPNAYSNTPSLRIIELILEIFADEWLPMAALHFRWNYPENRPFIIKEFGKSALPRWPWFLQSFIAKQFGKKMAGYLPILGIKLNTEKALEQNTHDILSVLDNILSTQPFVMGSAPTIADFALYGPIYAHLYRDPHPDDLVKPYQHVVDWIKALQTKPHRKPSVSIEEADLIDTLTPLLQIWRDTHLNVLKQTIEAVEQWHEQNPDKQKIPKVLGKSVLKLQDQEATRLNLTYGYWMWQRVKDTYDNFSEQDKAKVKTDLAFLNVQDMLDSVKPCSVKLDRCRLYTITKQ